MDYKRFQLAVEFRIVYPNAGVVETSDDRYWIGADAKDRSKLNNGKGLSGYFKKPDDAWDDAYYQFAERQQEIYRLWKEAGSPQDLTVFILGLGILSEDESIKPDVTVG